MNIRKIKNIGPIIKENEIVMHPNILLLLKDDELSCPTKLYLNDAETLVRLGKKPIEKKNIQLVKNIDCNVLSESALQKYMLTPSLIISSSEILSIYNIITIEDIEKKILKYMNDKYNFATINRILNTWIKMNFNDLKKNNSLLDDIYINLFNNYFPKLIKNKGKKIIKFRIKWFKNKNITDFYFNFGEDLKYFLTSNNE